MKKIVMVTLVMLFVSVTSSFAFNNEMSIYTLAGENYMSKFASVNANSELIFYSSVEMTPSCSLYAYVKNNNNIMHTYRITNGQVTEGSGSWAYTTNWGTLELYLGTTTNAVVALIW